jgi:hypothetical protein
MTREEAKKEIEKVFEPAFANYIIKALTDGATESDMPCEDAISREEMISQLEYCLANFTDYKEALEDTLRKVKNARSVKVEPQKWIDKADKVDAKFGRHDYVCPKCNEYARRFVGGSEDWWCVGKPNYCPNCGAKMKGNKHE